jgi:16S rRNA (uracil1498-N3)-methyltransferase
LFVEQPLASGGEITLDAARSHYLATVMRRRPGEIVVLFNGADGAFEASLTALAKRAARLTVGARQAPFRPAPDLWLLFAPLKRARLDLLIEKATELGVRHLQPVWTKRAVPERVRGERLRSIAIEAAELADRLDVPSIAEPLSLGALLADWPAERRLAVCDEAGGVPFAELLLASAGEPGPWAILIGPEGGLAAEDRAAIRRVKEAVSVSLGPRVMRADTAACAALALWQALLGARLG